MADPAKLQAAEAEAARAQEAAKAAEAKESAIYREQRQVNAELRSIKAKIQDPNVPESEKAALTERGQSLETQYNQLEQQGLQANQAAQAAAAQARQAESDLRTQQQAAANNAGSSPTASAGEVQTEAAKANDDNANASKPTAEAEVLAPDGRIEKAPATTAPTNAEKFEPNADAGTQEPTRPLTSSQATPPPPSPAQSPGAGAASDDNTAPQPANATQARINKKFGGTIQPQPNILDQYASYAYQISIYLCSPADYTRLLTNKTRYLAGFQLLMQSGGAPLESGIVPSPGSTSEDVPPGGPTLTVGRNEFFQQDFYIDSVRMINNISGKGTRGSHGTASIKFVITEPNGISLFERLYNAVNQYVSPQFGGYDGPMNYAAQHYLMVIRWYGYDQNGKLVAPTTNYDPAGISDRLAIAEKLIPFRFSSIKFRIANKLTEYECDAVCPQYDIAQGQGRGVIPYNIELTGTSLKNLLMGSLTTTPDPSQAPPKANTAPQKAVVSGLAEALNKYCREQVDQEIFTVADEYNFIIIEPELADAKLRPPGQADKSSWGMIKPVDAAQAKDGRKQTANVNSKNISATAGMPIVQFLDLAVRNSTYIYDQQTKIKDPATGKTIPQGSAVTPAWFKIDVQADPIRYDPKRNDFAYKITYQISMYKINKMESDYFPQGQFAGTHKVYNYWFTGQNTQVLRYEQDFNYMFYLTVNSNQVQKDLGATTDYREFYKRVYAPNSPESNQGAAKDANEPGANAADYLYSPSDQAEVKMEIVGDPAWIQQGSLWYGLNGPDVNDPAQVAFLPDGTINFTSQEALFEVGFNKPSDYNLRSGLMDIRRRS